MSEKKPVKSPCISVCILNDKNVCEGCYRTALEITDWVMYSDDEKRDVLKLCGTRFKDMSTFVLK